MSWDIIKAVERWEEQIQKTILLHHTTTASLQCQQSGRRFQELQVELFLSSYTVFDLITSKQQKQRKEEKINQKDEHSE